MKFLVTFNFTLLEILQFFFFSFTFFFFTCPANTCLSVLQDIPDSSSATEIIIYPDAKWEIASSSSFMKREDSGTVKGGGGGGEEGEEGEGLVISVLDDSSGEDEDLIQEYDALYEAKGRDPGAEEDSAKSEEEEEVKKEEGEAEGGAREEREGGQPAMTEVPRGAGPLTVGLTGGPRAPGQREPAQGEGQGAGQGGLGQGGGQGGVGQGAGRGGQGPRQAGQGGLRLWGGGTGTGPTLVTRVDLRDKGTLDYLSRMLGVLVIAAQTVLTQPFLLSPSPPALRNAASAAPGPPQLREAPVPDTRRSPDSVRIPPNQAPSSKTFGGRGRGGRKTKARTPMPAQPKKKKGSHVLPPRKEGSSIQTAICLSSSSSGD
jgi:hypothetical protein